MRSKLAKVSGLAFIIAAARTLAESEELVRTARALLERRASREPEGPK
jgi:hypothetical protein